MSKYSKMLNKIVYVIDKLNPFHFLDTYFFGGPSSWEDRLWFYGFILFMCVASYASISGYLLPAYDAIFNSK